MGSRPRVAKDFFHNVELIPGWAPRDGFLMVVTSIRLQNRRMDRDFARVACHETARIAITGQNGSEPGNNLR